MTKALTILVTLALCGGASAETLREATREAMRLCVELDAQSLEHCGTEMAGRTPQHSAARKAVMRMSLLRNLEVRRCEIVEPNGTDCYFKAEWQIEAGASDILVGPVQYLPPR